MRAGRPHDSRRDAGATKDTVNKSDKAPPGMTPDRSAGVPPAVTGASRPRFGEVTIRDRGRLPHWEKESGTYFITFRLADSLPKLVLEKIALEREEMVRTAKQMNRELSPDERSKIQKLSTKAVEQYLDRGAGACCLKESRIADLVVETLQHFDGQRYRLFAWCIMPNHVHVLARILPGSTPASVVHSWKSFSSKQANKIRQVSGTFWEREYYDHLVRDDGEFARAVEYVASNPSKAGLKGWRWVWVRGRDAHGTAGETPALHEPSDSAASGAAARLDRTTRGGAS